MNADTLLDAIGMVDDHLLVQSARPVPSFGRRIAALIAAALIAAACVGTALAVSEEFRELVFSIFRISSPETPPDVQNPPEDLTFQPALGQLQVVDIDGEVKAQYFSGQGHVFAYAGGFYTCSRTQAGIAPEDAAFWQITPEGIRQVPTHRVDFPLSTADRTLHITFDYGILGTGLQTRIWARDLDQDPVGYAWDAAAIAGRTDAVLLSIPVLQGADYTHQFFLLELESLEMTPLSPPISGEETVLDLCKVTGDLGYALFLGSDRADWHSRCWLWQVGSDQILDLDALAGGTAATPYFLDDQWLILEGAEDDRHFRLLRYHIPSGKLDVLLEHLSRDSVDLPHYRGIQESGGGGAHGLVFREDGGVTLLDLRTREKLDLEGLDTQRMRTSESPDGSHILFANRSPEGDRFTRLGMLDTQTGILKVLTRQTPDGPEQFRGWISSSAMVITAYQEDYSPEAPLNYFVYVYDFQQEMSAPGP